MRSDSRVGTRSKSLAYDRSLGLTSTSLTGLNGTWVGEGGLDTHYQFEWGFDSGTGFEHSTPRAEADGGSADGPQTHSTGQLTGLVSDASYRYRIIASNSLGTSTGATMTFKTLRFPSILFTGNPPNTGSTLSRPQRDGQPERRRRDHLPLRIRADHGIRFEHSGERIDRLGLQRTPRQPPEITGLQLGTTYHYRIVVTGPGGSFVSPKKDQVVKTLPMPRTIGASSISERSPTAATVGAPTSSPASGRRSSSSVMALRPITPARPCRGRRWRRTTRRTPWAPRSTA